jgi:putative ABC transport system permease protein
MYRVWYNVKISFRYLVSHKTISLLNLMGLSIGMTVAILIFYFVSFERSYDNFHKDGNLIYRIISVNKGTGGIEYRATTPFPLPDVVRSDIKEAGMTTGLSLFLSDDQPVMVANQSYYDITGYTADSCFLKMFNFPMISGNPSTVFDNPSSVVLTKSTAFKLFGDENPFGKELIIGDFSFTVAGILKDLPENSVFEFDLLVSDHILNKLYPNIADLWWRGGTMTFVKLFTNADAVSIKSGLESIPEKYFPDFLKDRESYEIQLLEKIHLDNRVTGDSKTPISPAYLYILMAIAIAVLFIACTNFANLTTSQSEKRARETGLRKLAGGGRFQITCLFIGEALILSLIAMVLAVYLAILFLPWLNDLSQRNLSISDANGNIIFSILLTGILTGVLSGLYPALLFSKYQPIQILRSRINSRGNKTGFRNGFIIAQFIISIILVTSQLFISKQVSFMKNHELGFNDEGLITVPLYYCDDNKRLAFADLFAKSLENAALGYGIQGVTLTENVPGHNFPNRFAVIPEGSLAEDSREMVVTSIDEHFMDVFQIPLVSGRSLSDTITSDKYNNVMINETAAKKLGWENPVGKQIRFKHETDAVTIVGVMKDINIRSLQTPVEPVVYRYVASNWLAGYVSLRANPSNNTQTLKYVNACWESIAPGLPFQYFFIKDKYIEKYKEDERLLKIVGTFALIAISLSCLGLFALIAHLSMKRTKEIGIRKINGARTIDIMLMLSSEFFKLVAIAFVIACPLAWYMMHKWLQNFAYKTELSWWIFGLSGIIAIGISIFTVSFHTWKTATRNPVEALRYE